MHHGIVSFALSNRNPGLKSKVESTGQVFYSLNKDAALMKLRYGSFVEFIGKWSEESLKYDLMKIRSTNDDSKPYQMVQKVISAMLKLGRARCELISQISGVELGIVHELIPILLSNHIILESYSKDSRDFRDQLAEQRRSAEGEIENVLRGNSRGQSKDGKRVSNESAYQHVAGEKRVLQEYLSEMYEGDKRFKSVEVESDTSPKHGFYAVNLNRLNVMIRNELISVYATQRIHTKAGKIMKVLLNHSTKSLAHCTLTPSVSASQAFEISDIENLLDDLNDMAVEYSDTGKVLTKTDHLIALRQIMDALMLDDANFLIHNGNNFTVNIGSIVKHMKATAIENIIRKKFRQTHLRVYRCILSNQLLDEKIIAKKCLLPIKETREIIMSLLRDGFIDVLEVPKGNDRAPSRCIYMYKANRNAQKLIIGRIYKSILNIRERYRLEAKSRKNLLKKAERTDIQADDSLLSHEEKSELVKFKKMAKQFEGYQIMLDSTLALFKDY